MDQHFSENPGRRNRAAPDPFENKSVYEDELDKLSNSAFGDGRGNYRAGNLTDMNKSNASSNDGYGDHSQDRS